MQTALYWSDAHCLNYRQCGHAFTNLADAKWLADDTNAYPVHQSCAEGPWPLSAIGPPPENVLAEMNNALRRGALVKITAFSAD